MRFSHLSALFKTYCSKGGPLKLSFDARSVWLSLNCRKCLCQRYAYFVHETTRILNSCTLSRIIAQRTQKLTPWEKGRSSTQLLCSIEKAVWKLAQSGLSTEAKIYYYRFFHTSTFFSNCCISETKQDFWNASVPKFLYRRGLSWKWPRPTLSSSFLRKKTLFRNVPGGPS